ncbi:NlpC/P60 family protein [Thioclava sp. A2]|uniref:C40 family peptidase n=1 Tax=Thioclava sp. FCG-A2 TaxID=3080562 RepID=UPI002954A706|nr:NlpC/P60 family protein [Thioclava sp. A2]MDV7270363.1 NlpC/P60 family protein [Thioclava sp. A2]
MSGVKRDRRLTPFSGRIAHRTLQGVVSSLVFTEGEAARIIAPVTDLCAAPDGARDRQLLFGAAVLIIERRMAWTFVQAQADGYCGWVASDALGKPLEVTHRVSAAATHGYRTASIKAGEVRKLSLGATVTVFEDDGPFAVTEDAWIPRQHLRPLEAPEDDPVAVAERLLNVPYLWGGNSHDGIDCSGLVQAALMACGLACPADSDMQWAALGALLPEGAPLQRGDLLFWKGHVALACDATRLIHANGHTMSVAYEGIAEARARIDAASEGTWLGARRIARA